MSSSILKYGQIIKIRSYEYSNTFLTSKSYTDQNLYFQTYNKENTFPSGGQDVINISNYRQSLFEVLPTSSFEINDQMNSQKIQSKRAESAPRAKTEQEQFKAIISEKRGKGISFGDKVIFRHLDSQYYIYGSFDCASSGIGAFKIELKKQLSQKIIFKLLSYRTYEKDGDEMSIYAPFKIYHCQTQCYVSYCFERLFLDSGSPETTFANRLQATDKDFPVEAPKIKEAYYLQGDQQLGENGQEHVASSRANEILPRTGRFLIINENIPKRVFKLVIHNEFEMKINKTRIRNHDVVYFIHTEKDQYVCPSNFSTRIFLKKRLEETDLTDIFDGLWEIQEIKMFDQKAEDNYLGKSKTPSRKQTKDISKKFGNITALGGQTSNLGVSFLTATIGNPILEGQVRAGFVSNTNQVDEEGDKGNKKKEKYILRHLASGRIMYLPRSGNKVVELQQFQGIDKKMILLESIDAKLQDGALVQFTYKTRDHDTGKFIKKYLAVSNKQDKQKEESNNKIQEQDAVQEVSFQEEIVGNLIEQAYNSKFQKSKLGLEQESSQHGFRIYKISEQVKQLCLYVLSSQQILSKFTRLIGEYLTIQELLKQLNVALLNNVINVLKCLIGFIYDCEYSKIAQSGNNPISKKQRIFDELGMIELITRMLQQINRADFPSEENQAQSFQPSAYKRDKLQMLQQYNKNSQYRKIRTAYELGYKLLESIAANNDLMKIRISKYMKKYLNHIMEKANRTVYRSIQEFLDGNYLALQEIQQNYIKELISNYDINDPDPADLYFLSRLCLCKEKTVPKNQTAIFINFYQGESDQQLQNQQNQFSMQQKLVPNKFKFREDQQKMQILSCIIPSAQPQYRTLSQLFQQCNLMKSEGGYDPDKNHWSYFMQYLNLLADICVKKNNSPLSHLKKNLPIKTLVAFLHESTVKKNLLFQPFIRLVHHAFVETSDYQQINRITKVKEWDELSDFNIPKAKNSIPIQIKKTMALIFDYIRRINKKPFVELQQDQQQKDKQKEREKEKEKESHQAEPQTINFDADDRGRLINVKTFLQILKSTLNLGFWPEIDEMKKMVPYLLKIMRYDIQYSMKILKQTKASDKLKNENGHLNRKEYRELVYGRIKQQVKLNKPNIVLLVECKILAARILNIIIDYQYNVRVSIITKYFKDVMQYDVDLSKYNYDKMDFIKRWSWHIQYDQFAPSNQKEGYLLIDALWIEKVTEILNDRDIFSECVAESVDTTLVFFEAFVYSNTQLTNLTLELINRVTNQRQQILRTFKDIIFVAGGHLKNLAIRGVQTTRSTLLNLTSPTIREQNVSNSNLWLKIRKGQQSFGKIGVVQQLASLTMSMMKNFANPNPLNASQFYSSTDLYPFYDILTHPQERTTDVDGSYLIISQKDQNLQLNQNLIKSQDHHMLIIGFIKIMQELPTSTLLPMRALHAAYNFLTVLIWNNNENKKQLESILKIAECHLEYNVGCIDFFKQMYINNKKLVKKSEIKSLIEKIIGYANQMEIKYYQKSKLMDFLRIAVIFDDQGYDINQNMVMELISQYQVSSNNQIVYLKAEENTAGSLSQVINRSYKMWIGEYSKQYHRATFQYHLTLNVSPQLFYVATFFEVFSALIQNENVVNIGKASNMHPIDYLLSLLKKSEYCWIVIRHLRAYLNRLYYFDKRSKDSSLYKTFIETDIPIIRQQLRGIVQLICNIPEYNTIKIVNPIRYSYLGSYVFLALQQILHSLDLFVKERSADEKKEFQNYLILTLSQLYSTPQESENQKYQLTFTIIQIIEMLEYLLKTIDGRYINKYISRVSKRLRTFVLNAPYRVINLYTENSKRQTTRNIEQNKISSDDIPFRKSYLFHDGKGFWRHLVDWNSFKDQQIFRQRDLNKVQKRIQPNPNETKEAGQQRKRDYMLEVLFLGNIDKKIQKAKAKPKDKIIQLGNQMKEEGEQNKIALHKNLTTSTSNRFRIKNQRFTTPESKNIVINQRRKKLVKFLEVNQKFMTFGDEQVDSSLYDFFASLNQASMNRYQNICIVGNEQVVRSIVKMNEIDPQSIKSEYKMLIIKLFTNYIQRESIIFKEKEDIQNWQFTKEEDVQMIRKPQNELYSWGVATFLSSLIINDLRLSIEMAKAILMLGISLLVGKNKLNQDQLFKLIKEDERNLLLCQISSIVKDCGASIAAHLVGGQVKQYNMTGVNYSDTYDFYIDNQKIMKRKFVYQPETVLEQKEFDQKVINMQFAFAFLKNLCEGNIQIKEYIREQVSVDEEQKPKAESVNFLTLSISQLRRMFINFNIEIIKVPFSIINFIYEVTQIPCLQNQRFVCRSSLFSDFASLQLHISEQIQKKQLEPNYLNIVIIFKLYSLNIKNVISCLEGNINDIYASLSTQILCKYFVRVLAFYIKYLPLVERIGVIQTAQHLEQLLNKKKLHESYYLDMFLATSVIVKLQKKTPVVQFSNRINLNIKRTNLHDIFELLKKNLLGIEIRTEGTEQSGDQYQTLFFPRHKVFKYLSRTTRVTIMEEVDRSTQRDKIIGLLGTKEAINQEIQYNYILDNQYTLFTVPFSITNAKIDYYMNLGLKISAVICALMAYFAAVVYFPYEDAIEYDLGKQSLILSVCAIVQFLVALMYFFLWTKTHLHLAVKKYERLKREAEEQGQAYQTAFLSILFKIPGFRKIYCLKEDGQFGNLVLFMFGSTMGMFYKIEWFSILLINLLMARLQVLNNILQALKASMGMLGMLSFFGASFICFFSVFSIYYYVQSIYPQKYPKDHCQSVFGCIIQLYIKEEIGNDMQVFQTGRFVYDMIYVVFMDMLFGNIVGGVLIDNFASLRGARQEMLKDKTEKCFICGIDRQTLQKKSQDLKRHYTQQYHKLWNYVFYLYYLEQQTKKTGLQQIIVRKYMQQDVSWIPLATSGESDIGELLSQLQKLINQQSTTVKAIELKE